MSPDEHLLDSTSRVPNSDADDSFFTDTTEWYRTTIAPLMARREAALAAREARRSSPKAVP